MTSQIKSVIAWNVFEKYTLFQPCSCILVSILAFSSFNLILSTYGAKGSKVEFLQLLKVANTECLSVASI